MRTQPQEQPSFEKVWLMFEKTDKKFQKTDEEFEKTKQMFEKTDKEFQETKKELDKRFKKTDEMFHESQKEFDRRNEETNKKIKELSSLFTTQWGKLIEALVEPSCLHLFQERGIDITQTITCMKSCKNGKDMECDIVLVNNSELVNIEVKTTMKVEYINEHIKDLGKFKYFFPQYKELKLYGAVAALKYEEESDKFAYRNGLFVLKSIGESLLKIANNKNFKPKIF